jgi:hypothetical protein
VVANVIDGVPAPDVGDRTVDYGRDHDHHGDFGLRFARSFMADRVRPTLFEQAGAVVKSRRSPHKGAISFTSRRLTGANRLRSS